MPHYTTTFGGGFNFQGRGSHVEQSDTFEFADTIGGNTADPADQPAPTNTTPTAPKTAMTGDSFVYADPPQGESPDTPPTEMGDDFVI